MDDQTALDALLDWLDGRYRDVMDAERQALDKLRNGDTPGHNGLMRRKAQLLADMAGDAAHLLDALPEEARGRFAEALRRFSASARLSLKLGSVFYMSALLYPDDHQPGQPDNLKLCLRAMREQGLGYARKGA